MADPFLYARGRRSPLEVRLKESFFLGLRTPAPGQVRNPLQAPTFNFEEWRQVCGKLYPAVLTGLLQGKRHYLPKRFLEPWKAVASNFSQRTAKLPTGSLRRFRRVLDLPVLIANEVLGRSGADRFQSKRRGIRTWMVCCWR